MMDSDVGVQEGRGIAALPRARGVIVARLGADGKGGRELLRDCPDELRALPERAVLETYVAQVDVAAVCSSTYLPSSRGVAPADDKVSCSRIDGRSRTMAAGVAQNTSRSPLDSGTLSN